MTHQQENALVNLLTHTNPDETLALLEFYTYLRWNVPIDKPTYYQFCERIAALIGLDKKDELVFSERHHPGSHRPFTLIHQTLSPQNQGRLRELMVSICHLNNTLLPALHHIWEHLQLARKEYIERDEKSGKQYAQEAILR